MMLRWLARLFLLLFGGLIGLGLIRLVSRLFDPAARDAMTLLFAEPGLFNATLLTVSTALASTALSVLMAAMCLAGLDGIAGRGSERVSRIILAMPHAAFAAGLFLFLTPGGWAVRIAHALTGFFPEPPLWISVKDPDGIVLTLALVLKETPFLVLLALPALARLRLEAHEQAAAALGHGKASQFFTIIWPRLYRELRLPVLAVLVFGIGVVDMAQILGPTTPATLAVLVTRLVSAGGAAGYGAGEAGALLLIGVALLAVVFWLCFEKLVAWRHRVVITRGLRLQWADVPLQTIARLALILMTAAISASILTLAISAFAGPWPYPSALPHAFTMAGWKQPSLTLALGETLLIALPSAVLALVAVLLVLESRGDSQRPVRQWQGILLFSPLLLPQLSLIAGVSSGLALFGIGYGITAVIIAHLLYTVPYAWLSLSQSHAALDPRYGQVAMAMGQSRRAIFFRVRLPMLLGSLSIALAIGASVSFAQYLPTLIAGGGRVTTIATEAVALASGGERRPIAVFGLLQALLPALGFFLAAVIPFWVRRMTGWIGS
jgi:putative thiamine transport system permease protein